jgi:hypothetical protein
MLRACELCVLAAAWRRLALVALVAATALAGAVCSRQDEPGNPAAPVAETAVPDANLAAADMGGAIEDLTDNYGPGFTGRRLIDGLLDPTWKIDATLSAEKVQYPQQAVISFYERQPAVIKAVVFVLPEPAEFAPKDVEVWTSMDAADNRYAKAASATLTAKSGEQTVSFSPVEARFVKVRIVSGATVEGLEVAEVRVLEGSRSGYTPLFVRAPLVKLWKGSPREAAQRGLDWLQHAAPTWTKANNCFGCHVHAQVLMGQAVAQKMGYRVNMRSVSFLNQHIRGQQSHGAWWNPQLTGTAFGAMGTAYAADLLNIKDDKGMFGENPGYDGTLQASADRLVEFQEPDGALPFDLPEPPIVQGKFMTTANALVSLKRASANFSDPKYPDAAARAVSWIASHEPQTTQDKIFKVIALMHYGTPDQKRSAWSVVEMLTTEQQPDGGWKEHARSAGSNAIATGQVLYAFKQAGVSIHGDMFRRGVNFLLKYQENTPVPDNGSWPVTNTDSHRPSSFAHTMWAVIGLAGSYGAEASGALKIVKQQGAKAPTRNLLIVLDVSGSMNIKLGDSTRWKTAMDVLTKVIDQLPEDLHVGFRAYAHRFGSKSPQTCTDTELVAPIARLDRRRILTAASRLRPRGETPLMYSVLQTIKDLKAVGGGSVALITDGEESCGGDAKAVAAAIKASGVNLTLNIVGFTLTGQATSAALGTLAGSTGGRYYGAQDGAQLSRAMMLAALHRLPYDILDASGRVLVSGQTSELSRELPPGTYRLRIDALGQVLEESITITPNQTTSLALGVEGDRFVLRR